MRSFAIVIRRAYFEAKKRRNYAKNVVVNSSAIFGAAYAAPDNQIKQQFHTDLGLYQRRLVL